MATCAVAVQQADGTLLLALSPTTKDLSTCPYLVEDGTSNAWRELGNMSVADAQVIGASVGVVWAIAWGFKAIRKSISTTPERD